MKNDSLNPMPCAERTAGSLQQVVRASKCLNPTCDRESQNRGLCHPCYVAAYRLVKAGKTTWADMEARGVVTNAKRGPKPKTIAWLMGMNHIDELEYQETGKITP